MKPFKTLPTLLHEKVSWKAIHKKISRCEIVLLIAYINIQF